MCSDINVTIDGKPQNASAIKGAVEGFFITACQLSSIDDIKITGNKTEMSNLQDFSDDVRHGRKPIFNNRDVKDINVNSPLQQHRINLSFDHSTPGHSMKPGFNNTAGSE